MFVLPSPSYLTSVKSMEDYHIFTFGEPDSGLCITTVFRNGECRDSYVVVRNPVGKDSYITLEFVK